MDTKDLATFAAVARLGGMGRAARALNTVQSNITQRVRRLEESLGVALFERSRAGARLTPAGERLMPCHEFCGVGHAGMWAKVKIVDKAEFAALAAKHQRLSCVE